MHVTDIVSVLDISFILKCLCVLPLCFYLLILMKENYKSANQKVYRSNVNISSNATISKCFFIGFLW